VAYASPRGDTLTRGAKSGMGVMRREERCDSEYAGGRRCSIGEHSNGTTSYWDVEPVDRSLNLKLSLASGVV
jgi:hypothetical protein